MDKRLGNIYYSCQFVREVQWLQHARYPPLYVYIPRSVSAPTKPRERYRGFVARNGALYCRLHPWKYLRAVSTKEADDVLSKAHNELGDFGRDRFNAWLRTKYAGLSRRRVMAFLENQESHQLALPVRKQKVSHSIVAEMPMQRWQADPNVA